jgi:hypothetical protein
MEMALTPHAGLDDVVTPLGFEQDLERLQADATSIPRNFSSDKGLEKDFVAALRSNDKKAMRAILRQNMKSSSSIAVRRHAGAEIAKRVAGDEFWNRAFKFTIERHPYEKVVSLAWFRAAPKGDFSQALDEVLKIGYYRNFDLYTIDGKLAVDFIIRYEKMDEDVPKVEKAIGGLSILDRLPRANSDQRKDRRAARDVLTAEQKIVVQNTCREEFEMLGFEP